MASLPTCGYFAACALIAAGRLDPATQARMTWPPDEAPRRAAQALRFILATHRPAPVPETRWEQDSPGTCCGSRPTAGSQRVPGTRTGQPPDRQPEQPPRVPKIAWGHHWGSGITIERIANFVDLAKDSLPPDLYQAWLDMLACESDYQLNVRVEANRFSEKGETHGERNYWRGALLFRAARLMPNHPSAQAWLDKAASFFANAMSTPEDATSDVVMDGKPLRELHIGANAHPGCVFEHHGVFSSDYSVINASFHAMAMLGALRNNWPVMDTLSLHQDDLWRVIRHLVLPGGRIACVGKQRPRYSIMYCYLMPVLALRMRGPDAAQAAEMLQASFSLLQKDRDASGNGAFFSGRCQEGMERWNKDRPAYYYRLEADAILSLGL
ncbi:MAG TPA: hypothetical protein P5137_12310, partial [Candidatus Brocadiia bacterium]|nr:hypothetical protein [Candidatus Brocadiia bacterium]